MDLIQGIEGLGTIETKETDPVGIFDVQHRPSVVDSWPPGHHRAMENGGAQEPGIPVQCTVWSTCPVDPVALANSLGVIAVDVIDRARLHLLAEQGIRSSPPAWTTLVWALPGTATPATTRSLGGSPIHDLLMERRTVWGDPDEDSAAGVLMVSLVARSLEIDHPTFATRYRNHAEIARRHHGFSAYRQNLVKHSPARPDPDAVSEILLASEDDWRNRFYTADDSADLVAGDVVRFLDRQATKSTLVRRFRGN